MNTSANQPSENSVREALLDCHHKFGNPVLNSGLVSYASVHWHRGAADGMLMTPDHGQPDQVTGDDIVWVALDELRSETPNIDRTALDMTSQEMAMHRAWHAKDAAGDVAVMVHVQSPYATTLSCLAHVHRYGVAAIHQQFARVAADGLPCISLEQEGKSRFATLVDVLSTDQCCLLANDGLVTVASTVVDAIEMATRLEGLCRIYWLASCVDKSLTTPQKQMTTNID